MDQIDAPFSSSEPSDDVRTEQFEVSCCIQRCIAVDVDGMLSDALSDEHRIALPDNWTADDVARTAFLAGREVACLHVPLACMNQTKRFSEQSRAGFARYKQTPPTPYYTATQTRSVHPTDGLSTKARH